MGTPWRASGRRGAEPRRPRPAPRPGLVAPGAPLAVTVRAVPRGEAARPEPVSDVAPQPTGAARQPAAPRDPAAGGLGDADLVAPLGFPT